MNKEDKERYLRRGEPLRIPFLQHKENARRRGIKFELTFEQWLSIWRRSRKLHLRGNGSGRYVMARYGDKGPYAIGNIKIILGAENSSEQPWSKGRRRVAALRMIGKSSRSKGKHWRLSEETKRRQSLAQLGNKKVLGKIWITDGRTDLLVDPPNHLEDGWRKGRSKIGCATSRFFSIDRGGSHV